MNDHPVLDEDFAATLAAAQAGADWAMALLYRAHQPRLGRYLRAQAGQDGADVASDTWLDAARNLRAFTGDEDDFRGWLYTIARRRLVDHRRRQQRVPRPVGEATPRSPASARRASAGASASAEETALTEGRLGDDATRRIVAGLPDDQADVVLLRVVAGLSVEQVAQLTGRRPGTVRVLQHRALRRLARRNPDPV